MAGAGLAGLSAAYDLMLDGADVTVVDARSRLGGRVWTVRVGFADGQHAEAGGDLIDEGQHEIRSLAEAVDDVDSEMANISTLAKAWKTGDAATVERIVLEDMKKEPAIYERLLVARNRNWLPLLEALFDRPGRAFVVVGAAHLIGPDGLIAMLRARGYQLEQM